MGLLSSGVTNSIFSGNNVVYGGLAFNPISVGNKIVHTIVGGDGGNRIGTGGADPITLHTVVNPKGIAKVYLDNGDGEFAKGEDPLIGKSQRGPLFASISGSGGSKDGVKFEVYYHNSKTGVSCVMCYVNDQGYEVNGSASSRRSAKASASANFTQMAKKGVGVITDLETGIKKIVSLAPLRKALKSATGSTKLALAGSNTDASFGSIVDQILPAVDTLA